MKVKIKPKELNTLLNIEHLELKNLVNRIVRKAIKNKKSKYTELLK